MKNSLLTFLNGSDMPYRLKRLIVRIFALLTFRKFKSLNRHLLTDNSRKTGEWFYPEFNNEIRRNKNCSSYIPVINSDWETRLSHIKDKESKTFMDAGCGAGYILYRACEYFKHVIGFDFFEPLVKVAHKELSTRGIDKSKWTAIEADARNVPKDIMDRVDVFFMANPFLGEIMEAFIEQIIASIKRKDRDVHIIYVKNMGRKTILKHGVFQSVEVFRDKNLSTFDTEIFEYKKAAK
ncbi:MAG: class I SAM-dependent methyltransferase [Alphaproteobacteria bacterium]|nr:class I SAM-dependent methyltransferase [Alphaproteobacteria bacterium]